MKTSILKIALTNLAIIAAVSTTTFVSAQAPKTTASISNEKNSTVVYAGSLRQMYGLNEDGVENNLDIILSLYYDVKYAYVAKDPVLKQKLIDEFLQDLKDNGYKVPKKVKAADYFEPYNFILDLPVYLNKAGNIIPADQAGKGVTSYVGK
jgi:hypothetical protein